MKIYKISSRWSTVLVAGKSIIDAIEKYKKSLAKVARTDPKMTEIDSVQYLGKAL